MKKPTRPPTRPAPSTTPGICSVPGCGRPVAVFALNSNRRPATGKCARCRQRGTNGARRAAERKRVERALLGGRDG